MVSRACYAESLAELLDTKGPDECLANNTQVNTKIIDLLKAGNTDTGPSYSMSVEMGQNGSRNITVRGGR